MVDSYLLLRFLEKFDMESNRIWHEPVVEIYANLITPGVCCSAAAYDLANRRWYQLNVGDVPLPGDSWHHNTRLDKVPDDEWLSSIVTKYIIAHYHSADALPPWNTINTNSSGTPALFSTSDEALVRRPISESFSYGHRPSDKIPTTSFKNIYDKIYLSRGADVCFWNGNKCVFKRIEFDCDVESHENEIRAREALIQCISRDPSRAKGGHDDTMERLFSVVPILAVVLHDDTSSWIVSKRPADENRLHKVEEDDENPPGYEIAGFLTPYEGKSLDLLATPAANSRKDYQETSSPLLTRSSSCTIARKVPLNEEQLLDLACGVRRLSSCGIVHGDICHWNTVLTQTKSTDLRSARLLLIDMGDIAPDYEGDADALGQLLLWCLENSVKLKDSTAMKKRIVIAAALLKEGQMNRAIGVLSPSQTRTTSFKRRPSFADREAKKSRAAATGSD